MSNFKKEYTIFESIPSEVIAEIRDDFQKWGDDVDEFFQLINDDGFESFFSEYMQEGEYKRSSDNSFIYETYTIRLPNYRLEAFSSSYIKDQSICDAEWDYTLYVIDIKAEEEYLANKKLEKKKTVFNKSKAEWVKFLDGFNNLTELKNELTENYNFPKKN